MRNGRLAALVAEADRGALARTTAKVGQLLEEWLALALLGFSPKNAKETRGVLTPTCRLREAGGKTGRPLAPGTIRRHPWVPPPGAGPRRAMGLATETEVDLADFIVLAATTGARRSELVALRWTDLDLDRATV